MPSEKTARSAEKKRVTNRRTRSTTRTMVGKAIRALRSGEGDDSTAAVGDAVRALDRAVTKGCHPPQ